jgi:Mrp family chromosome partitioning ATPase
VLDTAPILAVPDSRVLAPFAHNLILVVRAEATPRTAARRAIEILHGAGVTPDGVVFNGYLEKRTLMGKNYSYGYYRYGKYGYGRYGTYSGYGTYGSVYGEEDED